MTPLLREQSVLGRQCRDRFFTLNPDLDAVVTDDPVHIGYLSGYRSVLQDMPPYTQMLVATRDSIFLVTGASDAPAALEVLSDPNSIWRYGAFFVFESEGDATFASLPPPSASPALALATVLSNLNSVKRIGHDLGRLELNAVVETALPDAGQCPIAERLRRCRAVKLPGELEVMRYVSKLTDTAITSIIDLVRPGTTEVEIAAEISRHVTLGAGVPRFLVVTSGERGSRVDAYASDRVLQLGDIVRLDIGVSVNGYYSDMARTYAVGDPGFLAVERYEALLRGELAELDIVRAGIPAKTVFEVAMREVRAGALPNYQRNHCGHGLGLRPHEFPLIGPASETILEEGMVLCLETPYYEIGWGGMMVEDTVIVTATGSELLTNSPRTLCLTPEPSRQRKIRR
ncbi:MULTISPECIES: Xaa-Pro peptidase family protein [unclassified Mesorhizobium]|uniref:M24 family metallopeptidase n=1 Tax=unclassified Mesorhizobium TaxID=325217 RepID=UPI00241567F2|nr:MULTISPECIES: Xaa-Pro peptidase family protein [unclassified Mesorhizobium]MDG4890106.1 Xaa-Pro peptidase family protein [Mesorhizobium sp. WSM4887]MDG4904248.1 Xaa-Pro peptidase family protein [Mesorhizobium sp. WSM4962]MDG4909275.1 Xaa-Pro peptidase family protein [Mesorhizobium sp. WSM4898]MDG4921899.1 Xaa-Pro peptidase family protein [Mesorhizobium sp. WSM4989]